MNNINNIWRNKNIVTTGTIFLFFIILITYGYFTAWTDITNWKLSDSDDAMRVLEVRAWLDGQGFYDLVNHRANPPIGSEMHWSRLSDAPLALLEILFKPFFEKPLAEQLAAFFLPPIIGLFFLYYGAKLSNKLYDYNYSIIILAALFISTSMLMFNFGSGRVDHHNLQSLAFIIMLFGIFQNNFKGGIIAGFALGASLTIGFELLPVQAISVAWVAFVWGLNPIKRQDSTRGFTIALFLSVILGIIINLPPQKYLLPQNDSLSIAQALPLFTGAISLYIATQFFSHKSLLIRAIALFVIGIIVIAIALQFPILRKSLYW